MIEIFNFKKWWKSEHGVYCSSIYNFENRVCGVLLTSGLEDERSRSI